jgi:hypothetical protein
MTVILNAEEIGELDRQNPATRGNGGFQAMLVTLQMRVNRATGAMTLEASDLARIARYAFDYRSGGWQQRLLRIFGRTLGPTLGRQRAAA